MRKLCLEMGKSEKVSLWDQKLSGGEGGPRQGHSKVTPRESTGLGQVFLLLGSRVNQLLLLKSMRLDSADFQIWMVIA